MLACRIHETWNCACGFYTRVCSVSTCHQGLSSDKNQWQYVHIRMGGAGIDAWVLN